MKVVIPQQINNPTELVGEVFSLSQNIAKLITCVKVSLADGGIDYVEVQNLRVIALETIKSSPNVFKAIGTFFSNLFRKKKKPQNDNNTTPKG